MLSFDNRRWIKSNDKFLFQVKSLAKEFKKQYLSMLESRLKELVLPDRNPDTLKLGYLLEPRFISYVDSGFFEIQAMIEQMLKKTTEEFPQCGDNKNRVGSSSLGNGREESDDCTWGRTAGNLMVG